MRHIYQTTVRGVGNGCVVGADGKTLTCIGSLPVRVGDTVYTDGRVIYGHVPIKAGGLVFNLPEKLIVFYVRRPSLQQLSTIAGYTKKGKLRTDISKLSKSEMDSLQNWLYTYKDEFYYGYAGQSGVLDYIDVWVTDNAVYTAEFTGEDAPIFGKHYEWEGRTQHDVYSMAVNMYFCESDSLDENGNRTFTQHYISSGYVYGNPIVAIKCNGAVIKSFSLGDYQFALDKLKEIYLQYDEPPDRDYPRFHWSGSVRGDYIYARDIWVSYIATQLLSFSFVGDNGEWEAVFLSITEGCCSPHTIDYSYVEGGHGEMEPEYSYFNFSCPVIYMVVKVKSDGTQTILQQRININSVKDNGVSGIIWPNATDYPVQDVALVDEPYFTINFGDCSMTTNLRKIGKIVDKDGNEILSNENLLTFKKLCTSDPTGKAITGALNRFVTYNLNTGTSTTSERWSFVGFDSSSEYGPILSRNLQIKYGAEATPMIERVSLYKFDNDAYLVSLRNQLLWYVNENVTVIGEYPANLNLEVSKIKYQLDAKGLNELIASKQNSK